MPPPPLDASAREHEEIRNPTNVLSLLVVLLHGAIGVVSILLAADRDYAAGKVAFAHVGWRIALGVTGGVVLFFAARGLYRAISGYSAQLTTERLRQGRRIGVVLIAIGAWFLAAATSEDIAGQTMALRSWVDGFYTFAGGYLVLVGLVQQADPTTTLRKGRVMRGEGIPGRGKILRADVPEEIDEDANVQVTVEFEIDAANRVYRATSTFSMEPTALTLLVPEATVDVTVDPADPEVFHVDWRTWRRPL